MTSSMATFVLFHSNTHSWSFVFRPVGLRVHVHLQFTAGDLGCRAKVENFGAWMDPEDTMLSSYYLMSKLATKEGSEELGHDWKFGKYGLCMTGWVLWKGFKWSHTSNALAVDRPFLMNEKKFYGVLRRSFNPRPNSMDKLFDARLDELEDTIKKIEKKIVCLRDGGF